MASPSSTRFLKNIKLLRIRHDLTQERVAELSGIDYKFYKRLKFREGGPMLLCPPLTESQGSYMALRAIS